MQIKIPGILPNMCINVPNTSEELKKHLQESKQRMKIELADAIKENPDLDIIPLVYRSVIKDD